MNKTYKIKNIVFSDLAVAEVRDDETLYFATMKYRYSKLKERCVVFIDKNDQVVGYYT